MDPVAIGFWGGYFGIAVVAFFAGAIPWAQGLRRVAVLTSAAPLLNGAYVVAALGWFPGGTDLNLRLQAALALHNSLALSALLLLMLRTRTWVWRAWFASLGVVLIVAIVAWNLDPRGGMLVSTGWAIACTIVALVMLFNRKALLHHRLAWLAVASVTSVSLGLVGTAWMAAIGPSAPRQAHAATAVVVGIHEVCMGLAIWSQLSHLAELQLVRDYGSGYDPVTRMRSLESAGNLINQAFASRGHGSVGAIVVTISNLQALEGLHGRAEHNQALFIMATRLRNGLPRGVQMGRLGPDVFLLLIRRSPSDAYLLDVARRVRDRLARPVTLGRGDRPSEVHLGAHEWVADFGIGVINIVLEANRAAALNSARAMSRTALTYPSRIAQFSRDEGEVVEALPKSNLGTA